jgi:hypothetical protein
MNAFQYTDPELTALFADLYIDTPSLFNTFLPRSEVEQLREENEDDNSLMLGTVTTHIRSTAIGCIQPKYAKDVLALPMREKEMSDTFRKQLRGAYANDYGMSNIYAFGKSAIQWFNKFAFNDRSVPRFSFLHPNSSYLPSWKGLPRAAQPP